jgi:RNA polymerase sigma factor (sigma-70 family)
VTPQEEREIVAAAQRGSPEAFARLVAFNQQAVRGFLRRLCGNHADADDLAQETFVTAWTRIGSFRRGESLRSWLCGVAWRKWMTHSRSERRRTRRETAAWREDAPAAAAGPDARLDAAALLQVLPGDQRAAVALCLGAGFSHGEAAAALGLPIGTVKSHISRGRAKLTELLGGADERS